MTVIPDGYAWYLGLYNASRSDLQVTKATMDLYGWSEALQYGLSRNANTFTAFFGDGLLVRLPWRDLVAAANYILLYS